MNIHKKIICIFCTVILVTGFTYQEDQTKNTDKIDLYAAAALLMDASNGRVLWEEDGYIEKSMASTTKIMTCIVALENGSLDDVVTVSRKASLAPKVKLYIKEGEQYRLGDLLHALMLESSNDVAIAIAEHIGGSVEAFCQMMDEKARDIGAFNTAYKTANGLDAEGHYTTAYDLALITRYAISMPEFIRITNTPSANFTELTKGRSLQVDNKNQFLHMMNGAMGVKTGFTSSAGYCFVGALNRDGKTFISVVLASGWPPNRSWKFRDTVKLMEYGLKNYQYVEVVNNNIEFDSIPVENGTQESVNVYMEGELGLLLKENEETRVDYELPTMLSAPVYEGEIISFVTVYVNNEVYRKFPIKTQENIELIDYSYCLDGIIKQWLAR